MKRISLILFSFAFVTFGSAFAGSGKAIIPHHTSNTQTKGSSYFRISNISENDIEVEVTFYDQDGSVISSGISYTNFITTNTEIGAGSTGVVEIETSSWTYGYAVIEWSNNGTGDDTVALLAHGVFADRDNTANTATSHYAIPVNGGKPF